LQLGAAKKFGEASRGAEEGPSAIVFGAAVFAVIQRQPSSANRVHPSDRLLWLGAHSFTSSVPEVDSIPRATVSALEAAAKTGISFRHS
jgi:hypothetical protein